MVDTVQMLDGNQDQVSTVSDLTSTPQNDGKRLYTDEEVDKLIGKKKHEAYERGKRDAMSEMNVQPQTITQTQPMQAQPVQQAPSLDEEKIRQFIADENKRQQEALEQQKLEAMGHQILGQFAQKLEAGKARYPDFEEKFSDVLPELKNYPKVILLANSAENTADVMHDLLSNPYKMEQLERLHERSPALAQREMAKLSNSIKQNQQASQIPSIPEPLSQIKPSNAGLDSGSMSINEIRKLPQFRG